MLSPVYLLGWVGDWLWELGVGVGTGRAGAEAEEEARREKSRKSAHPWLMRVWGEQGEVQRLALQ